jgi:hypothetical protein
VLPLTAVDKILAFVDRPWKIAAVVILVVTAVTGITLWEQRAGLAEVVLQNWVTPKLHPDRFPKIARQLLDNTGADIAVLAEVGFRSNLLKNIDGTRRGDPAWSPVPNVRPLYGAIRDPQRFLAFVEGRAVCHDVDPSDGEEERAEAAIGIKRRCYIAVPPVLDALVGGLAIGWRQPLSAEAEAGATGLLWQAASELATW